MAAFCEAQVKVTRCPTVVEVADADNVTVGMVTATVTVAATLMPESMQVTT
jgi:hypothetical protein